MQRQSSATVQPRGQLRRLTQSKLRSASCGRCGTARLQGIPGSAGSASRNLLKKLFNPAVLTPPAVMRSRLAVVLEMLGEVAPCGSSTKNISSWTGRLALPVSMGAWERGGRTGVCTRMQWRAGTCTRKRRQAGSRQAGSQPARPPTTTSSLSFSYSGAISAGAGTMPLQHSTAQHSTVHMQCTVFCLATSQAGG